MKHERSHTKKARGMLSRMGYRAGGHVKEVAAKAVHQHESHDHKGEKKTKLKLADGGCADGGKTKGRADRLARGGKPKGKSHVTVNVINAHGGGQRPPMPRPVPVPPPGAGAGPVPPPPGAAGPMPPPMNRGGRTRKGGRASDSQRDKKGGMPEGHFNKGGRAKGPHMTAGAGSGEGRIQKARAEAKSEGGKR